MPKQIDIKAIQEQIDRSTFSELETIERDSQKKLDDLKSGALELPLEEKATAAITAMHTLVLAEAKLRNKGWLYKSFRKLQLSSEIFKIIGKQRPGTKKTL